MDSKDDGKSLESGLNNGVIVKNPLAKMIPEIQGKTDKYRDISIIERIKLITELPLPVKLIKLRDYPTGFKVYSDVTKFVRLDEKNLSSVISISHPWKSVNTPDESDAKYLIDHKIDQDSLLFYDYSSIPQDHSEHISKITFKACLGIMDILFSGKTFCITNNGYYYRYWCVYECLQSCSSHNNMNGMKINPFILNINGMERIRFTLSRLNTDLRENVVTSSSLRSITRSLSASLFAITGEYRDRYVQVMSATISTLKRIFPDVDLIDDDCNPVQVTLIKAMCEMDVIEVMDYRLMFIGYIRELTELYQSYRNQVFDHLKSCTITNGSDLQVLNVLLERLLPSISI